MFSTFTRLALVSLVAAVSSNAKLAALQADASIFAALPFDYLIVGAGTAGLTLATRLSENPSVTVGVIEAGLYHSEEPLVDTPARFGQSIGSDLDWGFLTTPQPGANNGATLLSSAKMVGGSSGMNFMAWTRASKPEYDAWETLGNGPTWSWNGLLPYFKKVETYTSPPAQGIFPNETAPTNAEISKFHGNNGPIKVSYNDIYGSAVVPFVQAVNKMGVQTNPDSGSGDSTGIFNLPRSVDRAKGARSYAANAYLALSGNRPNLHILTNAHASKVIFSKAGGKLTATGVQYTFGRATLVASAKKEVILSAGSMQTPKLLELSGIGGKALLDGLGIETLLDMPQVGENLQDQPLITRDFLVKPDTQGIDQLRNSLPFALEQLKKYETTNNGLYTATVPAVAFVPLTELITTSANATNATINAMHTKLLSELSGTQLSPLYSAQLKIQSEWLTSKQVGHIEILIYDGGGMTATPPAPNSTYLTVFISIQHPFSRGSVHINSVNPFTPPTLNPGYLGLSIDADAVSLSGSFIDQTVKQQPLASMVVGPSTPPAGANFLNYSQSNFGTIWHPIGTAALAPQNLGGVVDPNLKVYGTTNLRVVDASIFPLHIATHPQHTIYAIAEKAYDLIRGINTA